MKNTKSKKNILENIHEYDETYLINILPNIKKLNKITGKTPTFIEKKSQRKNKKFGEYNINLIDEENDMVLIPDNATIKKWGQKAKYRLDSRSAKKFGHKETYLIHAYVWMLSRDAEIPKGWEIHHKDGDRFNNNPENLVCVPKSIHILLDRRSKEIERKRELTKREEQVVNTIYDMDMVKP